MIQSVFRRRAAGDVSSPDRLRFGFFVLNAAFALLPSVACGAPPDSARPYPLDSVVVTALPPFDWHYSPSGIQRIHITPEESFSSLNSVLGGAQGLYVKDYGGGAALATVSMRGMYSEETSVSLDGVRLNSFQNGVVDLSKIPLLGIAAVQIDRGGNTGEFDQSAGGSIDFSTAAPGSVRPEFAASVGSFGAYTGALTVPVNAAGVATALQTEYAQAANNYDYSVDGVTGKRASADYRTAYVLLHSLWAPPSGDASHELLFSYWNSDQGVAGAITSSVVPPGARQTDRDCFALLHSHWLLGGAMPLETSLHATYAFETFTDSALMTGGAPLFSESINRQIGVSARGTAVLNNALLARFGAQGVLASLSSPDVAAVTRLQGEAYLESEYTADARWWAVNGITLTAAGRGTANGDRAAGAAFAFPSFTGAGNIGAVATLFDDRSCAVRVQFGTAARIPTLNELYWLHGGNPNLQPDRSVKEEAGFHIVNRFLGTFALDADEYWIETKNLIVWEPVSGGIWSPVNIAHTRSSGIEWSVEWQPAGYLSLSLAHQISSTIKLNPSFPGDASAGKQLPYVPMETFHANVEVSFLRNALTLGAGAEHASYRYISTDNSIYIPGYTIFTATARARVTIGALNVVPELACDNLANESSQILPAYPMPERTFHFTIIFQYQKSQ